MYVEKDKNGQIIIQDISPEDASYLDDCICSYLSGKPSNSRTDAERRLVFLKVELEKLY